MILKCLILSVFGQKSKKLRNLWRFWSICGHFWPFLTFKLTLLDNIRVFLGGFWLFWWFSGIFLEVEVTWHDPVEFWSWKITWRLQINRGLKWLEMTEHRLELNHRFLNKGYYIIKHFTCERRFRSSFKIWDINYKTFSIFTKV